MTHRIYRYDDNETIADLPVSPTVRVLRERVRPDEDWREAERLGHQRFWQFILELPTVEGGDDFYPPATSDKLDAYCDRGL